MSTKIYNGYRLPEMTLAEITALCQKFRSKLEPVMQKKVTQTIASFACNYLDNAEPDDPRRAKPALKAWEEFGDIIQKVSESNRREAYDFTASITFIPGKNKTLALFYAVDREYNNIWSRFPGVKEYSYWNNSDKPARLTNKEWKQRENEWNEALGDMGIPARVGLSFEIFSKYDLLHYPNYKELVRRQPAFQERLENIAATILMKEKQVALEKENAADKKNKIMDAVYHYMSADGRKEIKAKATELVPLYKEKFTIDDFSGAVK